MGKLYSVVFKDGTYYEGGNSLFKTKWKEIPDKEIKRIFFRLPTGDHICLSGYEKYYYMVEGCQDVYRKNQIIKNPKIRLEAYYFMGNKKNKVIVYKVSLIDNSIKIIILDKNSEFIRKLNKKGWK